jgi:tetratricopeptide (TPR) repeat protein
MQFGQVQVSHAAKEAFRNQDYKPWHASRISSNTHSQDVLDLAIDSLCAACETLLDPAATIQYAFEVLASCTTALAEACLFDEAATLAEHVTCIVRLVATDTESVAARTWLVRWLNSLSSALARVGQPERALLVAIEAVELARALADQSPPLQAELSRSLFLLSSRYSVLRRTTEGICAIEEAVRIDRLLAEQHGDEAHQASLAVSLVLLSYCQRVVSQPEAALESSTQAIQLFRKLYDQSPDLYCADLATCLTSNANRQAALGHAEAAFSTCSEAVQLLRDLYSRRPEHYRHALAECLNSLSYRQLSRGRFTESLASAMEAVQLKQVVYADNPRLAAEYLAHGLDTLSDMQAAAGGLDQEALATLEEAIGMQRKLFQERPSMQGGSLAVMLFNASLRHAKLGHASESQAFRTECQAICSGSNVSSGIQLQLKLGRSDGVDLRRSLLASLEAQADVDDL